MIGQVTSALAGQLAAGGLFLTAMIAIFHRLPPGFLRFCTFASALLAALAAVPASSPAGARLSWAALATAAALWYLSLRSRGESVRGIAFACAAVAAFVPPIAAGSSAPDGAWLAAIGSLSAALLLGAVTVTMVLGHWYLVDTSLSIAPLRDGARWVSLAVALRVLAVGAALLFGGWEMLRIGRAADVIFSTHGLFFLFRSLMGLAAPLLLAFMIWKTVKMRSTQSATGLLYVALVLVLFGELISCFLRIATGYPL